MTAINETLVIAFTAFFATIGPIDVAVMYIVARNDTPAAVANCRPTISGIVFALCICFIPDAP